MWRLMKRFMPLSQSTRSSTRGRRSFKPDLEQLGERQLLSGSGVLSSITDSGGNTSVFAIGRDNRIYWAVNGYDWGYGTGDLTPRFREVSAGSTIKAMPTATPSVTPTTPCGCTTPTMVGLKAWAAIACTSARPPTTNAT
jgi:hypothetical protein